MRWEYRCTRSGSPASSGISVVDSRPKIRLLDSRHTTLSLMAKVGVPISIISKWAGHDGPAFTKRTYVYANDEDLITGSEVLAKLHKIT